MAYTTIDDPSAYFQVKTYTGTGVAKSETFDGNSDLQPDMLWGKNRSAAVNHILVDSNRGVTKNLTPNTNSAEATSGTRFTAFNSDGFSVGTSSAVNTSGNEYAIWAWKANGGTTSTNTDGDITTTVQANTTSGFSILTWTGNASPSQSLGHGLGVTPKIMFNKNRDASVTWQLFGSTVFDRMQFNTGGDDNNFPCTFNSTTITLPNLTNNTEFNASGYDFVSYVFAEKQGFSKFGKYTGNGNANGTFIYTGFNPAFVIIKRTDSADSWAIFDNKRSDSGGFNVIDKHLRADSTSAELDPGGTPAVQIDILSNGFKQREANGQVNLSGGTYIYMAFAENPFVTSTGIPTTAR